MVPWGVRTRFDVSERRLTSTNSQESYSLVDPPERGHIDSLTPDSTSRTNTGGVLTGAAVDDSVNGNLDGVLVGSDVDDGKSMVDDTDSHELLSVVAAVHHQGVGEALDNGALGLSETLDCITTSRMGEVGVLVDLDVVTVENCRNAISSAIQQKPTTNSPPLPYPLHPELFTPLFPNNTIPILSSFTKSIPPQIRNPIPANKGDLRQRDIPDFNIVICPLIEELGTLANVIRDLLRKGGVNGGSFFSDVRHTGLFDSGFGGLQEYRSSVQHFGFVVCGLR